MKKNIFPFLPDENLLSDIECLLKFLRQPLPLDEFFKKFSSDILKARLDQLEFKLENRRSTEYFVIKFDDNKIDTVELTNKHFSPLGITITDKTQIIQPLFDVKKDLPKSNLKYQLINLIEANNNKNKDLNIQEHIKFWKNKTLNLSGNQNKETEINIFFKFLRKLIIQENICKNFTYITPQSLLTIANDLTLLESQFPDLSTTISEMHILLGINSRSKLFNAPQVLLAYEKLFYKIELYFPKSENSETKIHKIIDTIIEIGNADKIVNANYKFFKLSYFGQKGFRSTFGNEDDINLHKSIQTSRKNFNSLKQQYLEIINLIRELHIIADNNQEVINLSKQLNCLTDNYFQTFLDISNSNVNKEYLDKFKKNALTELQDLVKQNIIDFRKKNTVSLDRINIFHKILNAIVKLIPDFVISKKTRIGFFQRYTPQNRILVKLEKPFHRIQLNL